MNVVKVLPIETVSEANSHEHWRYRHQRAKKQRSVAFIAFSRLGLTLPAKVTLTRLSPRQLDGDNLQGALKHVRDGVADAVGVDDRHSGYTWVYQQEKSKTKAVRIDIEATVTDSVQTIAA